MMLFRTGDISEGMSTSSSQLDLFVLHACVYIYLFRAIDRLWDAIHFIIMINGISNSLEARRECYSFFVILKVCNYFKLGVT